MVVEDKRAVGHYAPSTHESFLATTSNVTLSSLMDVVGGTHVDNLVLRASAMQC